MDPAIDERWRATFEARTGQHARLQAVALPGLDAHIRHHLRRSLAVFHLGESGDGTHLLEAAGLSQAGDAYIGALKHFVAEEQEHARMLAVILDALDGPLLSPHWSKGVGNRSEEVLETRVLTAEDRRPVPRVNARVERRVELKIEAKLIECRLPP